MYESGQNAYRDGLLAVDPRDARIAELEAKVEKLYEFESEDHKAAIRLAARWRKVAEMLYPLVRIDCTEAVLATEAYTQLLKEQG